MFTIINNAIRLTRGDTARFDVVVKTMDGSIYERKENEPIIFTVKKFISDTNYVIKIEADDENKIIINPEDTKGLAFGDYFYDIQINLSNGDINTLVAPNIFRIAEEVGNG